MHVTPTIIAQYFTLTCNNTCLPQTHNTYIEHFHTNVKNKVCHVHIVLSTLYQEKMVTEQEVKHLKPDVWLWRQLVQIQCTKPPDVANRTAELLAEVGFDEEGTRLIGQ